MKTVVELLKEEIKESNNYSKSNFGASVGEDFPEIVKEVVQEEEVNMHLMMGVLFAAMGGKELGESVKDAKGDKDVMTKAILKNLPTFQEPLSFLYWGIKVGRKLERQEAEVLSKLENL